MTSINNYDNSNSGYGHDYNSNDNAPDVEKNIEQRLAAVYEQMLVLHQKIAYFKKAADKYARIGDKSKEVAYRKAHDAAMSITVFATELNAKYVHNKLNLHEYQEQAKELFDSKNADIATLNSHRGLKEVLANVLAAMLGNLLFLAAAAFYGTFRLFKPSADAANKVNKLSSIIKAIEEEQDAESLDNCSNYGQCGN